MSAAPIMIVPGKNRVLHYVARQMAGISDVLVLGSANDALWQARQTPPRIVLADVQLDDMSGAELSEIMPNFAPNTRIIICGQADGAAAAQIQAVGAELISFDGSSSGAVSAVYQALDMAPPPILPTTSELSVVPQARTAALAPHAPAVPAQQSAPKQSAPAPKPVATSSLPPKEPAATPSTSNDGFAGSGSLVLLPQQMNVLTKLLELLAKEVEAQSVLLTDLAGMVLVRSGALPGVAMEMVGPLIATSFSTTSQLGPFLQEQESNAMYIHEGTRYDIYAFNISNRVVMVVMFDKRIAPGKLGTVWVYAKRAMRQLQHILKLPVS